MPNTERDRESLVFRIEESERRLDDLSEQFNNRPERKQLAELKDALAQLYRQLNERSDLPAAQVEVVNVPPESVSCFDEIQQQPIQMQSYQYQLVFDRSGSRAVLMEALLKAQQRLIIVCPWLNRNSIDADLMQKFRDCLNRNCRQSVNLSGANLSGANLCGANLSHNENLSGVNLTKANLSGANLEGANLEKANLKEANLSGANLKTANLSGAIMPDGTVHE